MSEKVQNIVYAPLGWMLKGIARLPWRMLYWLADIIYFLAYKLIGYRVKVVRKNLSECFPERDETERRAIEKEFYRHFADYFVETIKMLHVSDDEMRQRMEFRGAEVIEEANAAGQSIVLYAAHYGNWEWVTSVTLWFTRQSMESGTVMGQVYQPLNNRWFDRFFLSLRERFNTKCFTQNQILREALAGRRVGRHIAIGFIVDQHPYAGHEHYVRMFLNHPSAIITGPEAIARKLDCRAAYFDVEKISRGHYRCTMVPMCEHGADTEPHQLTDRYIEILENRIQQAPAYWLWTHKRWKRPVILEDNGQPQ